MPYQEEVYAQELRERFESLVKRKVKKEVNRIINSATCFDCDNPLTVLETEDGIAVKECSKCHGINSDPVFKEMDRTIANINRLTAEMGRGV